MILMITAQELKNLVEALESAGSAMATSSRDQAQDSHDAWVWGIICGWEESDDLADECIKELQAKHHWDQETVDRMRRYRTAVQNVCKKFPAARRIRRGQ